jgi:hypothetical protein
LPALAATFAIDHESPNTLAHIRFDSIFAVEYELPKIVSKLLRANEGGYVNRKVSAIIQRDLETFKGIAEKMHAEGGE